MKELVLSLLSRGYGHVVQPEGKRQYGRLEVCFEPEDYFIWKSQPPLLRLTSSGRLLSGVEPTPPKTYSTRRGPLILFTEDFASSFSQPDKVNRKEQAFRASRQEAEFEFYSLRDLTEAALLYSKKQAKVECHTSMTQPMLPNPKPGTKHLQAHQRPGDVHSYLNQTIGEENEEEPALFRPQGNSLYPRVEQVRYQPRFLCFPPPNRPPPRPLPLITPSPALRGVPATSIPTGAEECSMTRDSKTSFRTEVVTPKAQMSPIPESDAWEQHTEQPEDHNVYMVAEHLTGYPKDLNGQWKQSAIETGGEEGGHAPRPAYMNLSLGCSHLSKVPNDRRQAEGGWHPGPVKQSGLHLPPIKQPLPADTESKDCRLNALSMTQEENHKEPIPRLPDIHQPEVSTETAAPRPPERTVLNKVLVLLPLEPMEQDGLFGFPEEKEKIEDVLCSGVEQKVELKRTEENRPIEHGSRLKAAQHDNLIGFEPEEYKEQTAVGPLPPFIGRRGLGKQCSMAHYRQDPHDPVDQSESQPGIIRGSLPLELRECQKDGLLGTLIMGPAGEIICLSFWDSLTDTEDHPTLEDAMKEHVVKVMNSEGVLVESWTVLDQLEEQATQTGGMNDREVEAKRGHKKQTSTDREACVPEQKIDKANYYRESQPYLREDDIMQQTGGRAQRPQPKARPRSGSPLTSVSDSSTQKTTLSTPPATNEHIETETYKTTVKLKKLSKLDNADHPNMSNTKKQKINRHANRVTDVDYAENKAMESNVDSMDTESQDTSFSEETASGTIQKKNKNTSGEKATRSRKSQYTAEKIKKKSKGQAAFVVGRPRQSQEIMQTEKKKYSSERHEKTVSKRQVKESEDKSADDYSCGSSEYSMDDVESREVSTVQKNRDARHSSDIDEDFIHHEKCVAGHSMDTDRLAVSREDSGTGDVDHLSIGDFHEINRSAVSSRTHSSARSSSTSTWSIQRSSVSSDTGLYSPVQLPHLFPRLRVPTHHPGTNPDKSDSAADAKSSAEAIKLRENRVAAVLAAKAERHRMEVEKKRKDKEEEKEAERKRQEDKELTEERMRLELEEERRQRAQQTRSRKLKEEEERQRQAEREKEGQRSAEKQPEMERERRRQEEARNKKRYLERLQKVRQEEEIRRADELKRQHEEEEAHKEEEYRRFQEMDESERKEYLCRKQEEEEERRKAAEVRRHAEEEAAMWYEEFNRQRAALEQNLQFHRGLFVETEGLKQKQSISRPWVFSYFSRLSLAHCNTYEE